MKRWELLTLLVIPVLPFVQDRLDLRVARMPARQQLYLPDGQQVRRLCPGFEMLMADLYWLRTVQYYGGQRAFETNSDYALLRPLIEITTSLDPRLEIAYRYGAIFLSEARPNGAGDPESGVAIMERGVRDNPQSWRLRQYLAFTHFFYRKDSGRAAEILLEASDLPGAPFWLRTLAADLASKGGDRGTARAMWKTIYDSEEGAIKGNALFRLQQLAALDTVDSTQQAISEFEKRLGRLPRDLAELRSTGLVSFAPVDPDGTELAYDQQRGVVSIARESRYWRPM